MESSYAFPAASGRMPDARKLADYRDFVLTLPPIRRSLNVIPVVHRYEVSSGRLINNCPVFQVAANRSLIVRNFHPSHQSAR